MLTVTTLAIVILAIVMAWCIGTAFSTLKLQSKMRIVLPIVIVAFWAFWLLRLWVMYLG